MRTSSSSISKKNLRITFLHEKEDKITLKFDTNNDINFNEILVHLLLSEDSEVCSF